MSVVVLASAKGSPGVTTAVVALAAGWPAGRRTLVVELDSDGSDLGRWFRLPDQPGLMSCAARGRHGLEWGTLLAQTQPLPGPAGARVLVGPGPAWRAGAVLASLDVEALGAALAEVSASGIDVLVDGGRARPDWALAPLAKAADRTLLVCRPTASEVAHLSAAAEGMRPAGVRPGVLLVGDRPYGAEEVGAAVGVGVLGVLADDPEGAAVVAGSGSPARWGRSALLNSARAVAGLLASTEPVRAGRRGSAATRRRGYPVDARVGSV